MIKKARLRSRKSLDVILVDTAGRLHRRRASRGVERANRREEFSERF